MRSMRFLTRFTQQLLAASILVPAATLPGQGPAPPSERDIWQIAQQELQTLNAFQSSRHGFLMDAYAQYLGAKGEVLRDSWNLVRISWGPNGLTATDLALPMGRTPLAPANTGVQKSRLFHLHKPKAASLPSPEAPLSVEGVAPMMFPDTAGIGMDRYSFQYLGGEVLGDLRTWAFLLKPKESAGPGAFAGKIWVSGHDIVRFSGTFVGPPPQQKGSYVSFDSVRFKAATGHWLPWRTYVDQTGLPPSVSDLALRARVTVWGLDAQATGLSGTAGVQLDDNVDAVHLAGAQLSSEDVYLEAERNFVYWLGGTGFLAHSGKFEREVCDPIIEDIVAANDIKLDRSLSCRIILTVPAETALFESVIAVSKSVFDLAPNTATVAILIAREVALAKIRRNHLVLLCYK